MSDRLSARVRAALLFGGASAVFWALSVPVLWGMAQIGLPTTAVAAGIGAALGPRLAADARQSGRAAKGWAAGVVVTVATFLAAVGGMGVVMAATGDLVVALWTLGAGLVAGLAFLVPAAGLGALAGRWFYAATLSDAAEQARWAADDTEDPS